MSTKTAEAQVATKKDANPGDPPRDPRLGEAVEYRLPGGGKVPMLVDRLDGLGRVSGLVLCSRLLPPFRPLSAVPYSETAREDTWGFTTA